MGLPKLLLLTAATLILGGLLLPAAPRPHVENFDDWYAFTINWRDFLILRFGCPDDAPRIDAAHCKLNQGVYDLKTYNHARDLAKKVFDLQDRKR